MQSIRLWQSCSDYINLCKHAVEICEDVEVPEFQGDTVIYAGIGGSAAAGDLLKDMLYDKPIKFSVSRATLPKYADENCLVVCVSYSGNTKETVEQFLQAKKRKCKVVCITSGGKLGRLCEKYGITSIKVPQNLLPRFALPYLLFASMIMAEKLGLLRLDLKETFRVMKTDEKKVKRVARKMYDKPIAVYTPYYFEGLARRFKNQLAENAKLMAKFETFPEAGHNEIECFYEDQGFKFLLLRDVKESDLLRKYFEGLKKLLRGFYYEEIFSKGRHIASRICSVLCFTELLSVEIAKLRGVKYWETKNINYIKNKL